MRHALVFGLLLILAGCGSSRIPLDGVTGPKLTPDTPAWQEASDAEKIATLRAEIALIEATAEERRKAAIQGTVLWFSVIMAAGFIIAVGLAVFLSWGRRIAITAAAPG